MAWSVLALLGGFVWARFSPPAGSRRSLIIVTVVTLVIVDGIAGLRMATVTPVGSLGGLMAINAGYVVGVVAGAILRAQARR